MGELSQTIFSDDSKKLSWASEFFEQGTRQLTTIRISGFGLGIHSGIPGPYGYPVYLAELEPLLVGLAYEAWPGHLLNYNEVPTDAPANSRDFEFQHAEKSS